MNISEGILDVLIDGGESIVQIEHYLTRFDIDDDRTLIIGELKGMLLAKVIYIAYPETSSAELNEDHIEEYWFELTDLGRLKWNEFKKRFETQDTR